MANPVKEHPNATAAGSAGALVTVLSVLVSDLAGYDPSSAAFWPAVATLLTVAVLALGGRRNSA